MSLENKYRTLIEAARNLLTADFELRQEDGVLHIVGLAPNAEAKHKLWDVYSQLDPNYISREVRMKIRVHPDLNGCKARLIAEEEILNIHNGPGVASLTIGQVPNRSEVSIIGRTNTDWWLIRIHDIEGYCYVPHVEMLEA